VRKDQGLQSVVYDHFGSASGFVVVDTEQDRLVTVENKATSHPQGACTPIEGLINIKINAVVVGNRVGSKKKEDNLVSALLYGRYPRYIRQNCVPPFLKWL
jgi:predicted Fe-Mo cluster-binding NifX family protein